MNISSAVLILLAVALGAANAPFLSDRYFMWKEPDSGKKSAWFRLFEWFVLYGVVMLLAIGLERKINGTMHIQSWEFWPTTLLLFVVFAMPGFIWQFDMKHYLQRYRRQKQRFDQDL